MSYEVSSTPKFEKLFKTLSTEVRIRILRNIHRLENDPFAGKRLHGYLKGKFSLRVGDYRIIYEILPQKVVLHAVGHRKKIYER